MARRGTTGLLRRQGPAQRKTGVGGRAGRCTPDAPPPSPRWEMRHFSMLQQQQRIKANPRRGLQIPSSWTPLHTTAAATFGPACEPAVLPHHSRTAEARAVAVADKAALEVLGDNLLRRLDGEEALLLLALLVGNVHLVELAGGLEREPPRALHLPQLLSAGLGVGVGVGPGGSGGGQRHVSGEGRAVEQGWSESWGQLVAV